MRPITVRTFGSVAALVGFGEAIVSCDGPLPLAAILDVLGNRYPVFSSYLSRGDAEDNLMICCGDQKLHVDSMVQPGAELLLITPIAGG